MKKVEGSNFGCIIMGYLDPVMNLLYRLLGRLMSRSLATDFINRSMEAGLADSLVQLISNLSPKSEMSPKGLISMLAFTHDCLLHESKILLQRIF